MYKNIAFEGGGICGMAYGAVVKLLYQEGKLEHLKRYAGSSVGSILATLLCMNAPPDFIYQQITTLDFTKLTDHSVMDLVECVNNRGISNGKILKKYLADAFIALGYDANITFKELHKVTKKTLYITGTRLSNRSGKTVYLSHHNYPDLSIVNAIRISCSFPFVFKAVKFDGTIWIDGGCCDNLPLKKFLNQPKKTIAVRIIRDVELEDAPCETFLDYVTALTGAFLDTPSVPVLDCLMYTVDVGSISSLQFKLTDEQKQQLLNPVIL